MLRWLKRHWKKILLLAVVVGIGLLVRSLMQPKAPEYVTAVSKQGDLQQTVEAVGTVVSERDLQLQFPVSGVVADVLVKEGDRVEANQIIATLRSGSQAAAVASARATLQSEAAKMRMMEEGERPEDIAIAEAEVQSKRASLTAAKTSLASAEEDLKSSAEKLKSLRAEAATSLQGDILTVQSTIGQELTTALTSIKAIDGVFTNLKVQDVIDRFNPSERTEITTAERSTESSIRSAQQSALTITEPDKALIALTAARAAAVQAGSVLQRAYDFIAALPLTGSFNAAERETHKSTLAAERNDVTAAISALDAALNSLRESSASFTTRISTEESNVRSATSARDKATADIATYEAAVQIAEAQLMSKRAGSRPADIDAQKARVRQMQADVDRAVAALNDTIIRAPVAGTITQVSVKEGELAPAGPVITMLGSSPFRVEMFVSEIDVPKVKSTQSGSILLDAFPDVAMKLHVAEIDPAATDREGVPKYRIKLDFVHLHPELKIGMTGDADIITGMRSNVVSVPRRAVLEDEAGDLYVRILQQDGTIEDRPVAIGMEGSDGDVEVQGVKEGETVIVLVKE